jgi:hypothetical protein
VVQDGFLHQVKQGLPQRFDACDFCLVRIERLQKRNDIAAMQFHQTFREALLKMRARRDEEAQELMFSCNNEILRSPDLTEAHKINLLDYYQAQLAALRAAPVLSAGQAAKRAGGPDLIREWQSRAHASRTPGANQLAAQLSPIARLSANLLALGARPDDASIELQLQVHLDSPVAPGRRAEDIVRALALGAIHC